MSSRSGDTDWRESQMKENKQKTEDNIMLMPSTSITSSSTNIMQYQTKKTVRTNVHDLLKENGLFDSLGCQFHLSIFLYQLFIHVFFPFLFCGPNPKAQGVRCTIFNISFIILHPIFFYVMIVAFIYCNQTDRELVGYSVVIPILFFFVHRTTVALKYATLSPTEYARFMSCHDQALIDCYKNQMELLAGWATMDNSVLYFELCAASSRVGVKINQLYLRINSNENDPSAMSQLRYWNAFVRGYERIDIDVKPARDFIKLPNGDYGISVFDMCLALIRRSNNSAILIEYTKIAVSITVFILIVIMVVPVIVNYKQIENPYAISIYLFTATIMFITYGRIFFAFLYVALLDVGRFCNMVKTLHCMIRLTDIMMHGSVTIAQEEITSCNHEMSKDRMETILSICQTPEDFHQAKACFYDSEKQEDYEVHEAMYKRVPQHQESIVKPKEGKFGEQLAEHFSYAMVPKVNLMYPENSTAWIYARLVIQNFGERFRYRTDIYIGKLFHLDCLILFIMHFLVSIYNDISASNDVNNFISNYCNKK